MSPRQPGNTANKAKLPKEDNVDNGATYLIPDIKVLDLIRQKDQTYEIVTIKGFEIYIVEQWATERRYTTVITSYTGDSEHEIKAGKITLPSDSTKWSDKMAHYFKEIESYGGKPKVTEQGILFINNLSKFPSNLNLLPVFGGCVSDVWDSFKVSLNLRKLNCGGRSALLLCSPSDVSEDKFRQIYKTDPKVDIMYSVEELVKLVQICLVDFKLLDPSFVDGLFCNQTEESIQQWWDVYGLKYYRTNSPNDGKLGPTTVSAILGFVLSCTFRLDIAGSDFPKEPFNYFSFRVNVGRFQKQYNLKRTWYLDPHTVEKLFTVTNKKSEISTLKKVVKYTVHELPGRTRSIQSAQEVLTPDLEKAIKYFNCSARLEYLWFGKGNVNNITRFSYDVEHNTQSNPTSTFRSGVGKIKMLPKKLQDSNDYPSSLRRKRNHKANDDASCIKADQECSDEECVTDEGEECSNIDDLVSTNSTECSIQGKKAFDCKEVFQLMKRRLSFPYMSTEVGVNQIGYGNHAISLNPPVEISTLLKRNKSFSFIEDAVLTWEIENPTPKYVSTQLISIKKKLQENQKLNHMEEFRPYRTTIQQKSHHVKRLKHKISPVFHRFEVQKQEDERITAKMEDIKAIAARLEYEIRMLQNKVRDAKDCVDTFVIKVETLEKSIDTQLLECAHDDGEQGWYQRLTQNGGVRAFMKRIETMSFVKWMQSYQSGALHEVGSDK
jgi:hypothetical protein